MRGYISKIRPAGSAIVAVLALSSTYGYAQDAAVSDVAPSLAAPPPASVPVIVPPASSADGTTAATAAQPMVQPTAPVEERIAAARAASEQEAAEQSARAATVPQAAPARRVERPARVEAPTAPPPVERAAQAAPQPEAPIASPPPIVAPDQATAAPEPVLTRAGDSATANDWVLPTALGGGALLLLGLGAAAVSRRRGTRVEAVGEQVVYNDQPVAASPVPSAKLAPAGVHGSLAAMVAAPPSAANPFLTPRKRMVRARFLLAQREKLAAGQNVAINEVTPPQAINAEPQMQTVYRMGTDRRRGMTFKPQAR